MAEATTRDPQWVRDRISESRRTYDDPLAAFPEGTILHLGGSIYAVRGSRESYRCDADEQTCGCGDYRHRKAATREACKHLTYLAAHLSIGDKDCCWCSSVGCYRCKGSGRQLRAQWEEDRVVVEAIRLVRDRQQREMLGEVEA